mgnify:CR=1 FL=1
MSNYSIDISHSPKGFDSPQPLDKTSPQHCKVEDLEILSIINKSRFTVFLAFSDKQREAYAMKVFPNRGDSPHPGFINESRFTFLNHPNIIKIHKSVASKKIFTNGTEKMASYLLMEYASNGDFVDIIDSGKISFSDEKLIRTYFHQLISALEYMHSKGMAHLDLKLDNMLLDEHYQLKIADFDASFVEGDERILGRGTVNFRAPELIKTEKFKTPYACDIYSAAVILFALRLGSLPYLENMDLKGYKLDMLLKLDDSVYFWEAHKMIRGAPLGLDENFKALFISMIENDPEKRATFSDIKKNKWYQGPVYTNEELKNIMEDME